MVSVSSLFSCVVVPHTSVGLFWGLFLYAGCFVIDAASFFFLCVVLFVGLMTQIYGLAYMRTERSVRFFISLLLVFVVSMCILVLANSFVVFFIAWELIGLCSFLLIGFWSTRVFSVGAAIKAVSSNRIPDMALLVSMCGCFLSGGVSDFSSLAELGCGAWPVGVLIQLGFIFAASAKSAQVCFTGWLLSAMEGPTPVSALMHAATLVTAGVILLVRCGPVFSGWALCGVFVLGAVTALLSGIAATAENDLKQVVALSTSSQMGLAFMFVGAGDTKMAFLHIAVHAVFKSLLFWGVGMINHYSGHQYAATFRFCVGFYIKSVIFVATAALIGTPFMSGFYSKEFILCGTLLSGQVFVLVCLSQILSVFYTCRLVWLCLFSAGRILPVLGGSVLAVGLPTILGSCFAVICGFFVFFEAGFLPDFCSI